MSPLNMIIQALGLQGLLGADVPPMPPKRPEGLLSAEAPAQPESLLSEVPLPPRRGLDIEGLKNAIVKTETGSFENPYIFTTVPDNKTFSSAFGPAQITYTLASDVLKNQGKDVDQGYKDYLQNFIQQGKSKINAAKNKRYTENVKPGGIGDIPIEQHSEYYDRLFTDALRLKGAFDPKATIEGVAKKWYGSGSEKANQAYVKKVLGNY